MTFWTCKSEIIETSTELNQNQPDFRGGNRFPWREFTAAMAQQMYYTFSAFLGPDVSDTYLVLPHADQIRYFEAYLTYLRAEAVQFPTSKRATKCHAVLACDPDETSSKEELLRLVDGRTLSGFGVCGTDAGFLPQCELSLGAAWLADAIGHVYIVENARVLNSRSFMFGWCHAEKQKLTDIHRKRRAKDQWRHVRVVVDRDMCPDCIAFASALARFEGETISIQDPTCTRGFRADGAINIMTNDGLQES
ncbi:Aste57867_24554 [Aphanomyces stellatus]|uniref:Aste57867_24554 protein n=1 Tax=Aphanomyces stellatus TaxID=120398 RepID=A0A485LSB1_9STRA|nr:hypothetical protein As57867_024477 [Aphanomyces stellatus]VFU01193.1 Aste57867_24554 [Aphanomyces stellatus]